MILDLHERTDQQLENLIDDLLKREDGTIQSLHELEESLSAIRSNLKDALHERETRQARKELEDITIYDLTAHGDALWWSAKKGKFVLRAIWLHRPTSTFYMYNQNKPVRITLSKSTHNGYNYIQTYLHN